MKTLDNCDLILELEVTDFHKKQAKEKWAWKFPLKVLKNPTVIFKFFLLFFSTFVFYFHVCFSHRRGGFFLRRVLWDITGKKPWSRHYWILLVTHEINYWKEKTVVSSAAQRIYWRCLEQPLLWLFCKLIFKHHFEVVRVHSKNAELLIYTFPSFISYIRPCEQPSLAGFSSQRRARFLVVKV